MLWVLIRIASPTYVLCFVGNAINKYWKTILVLCWIFTISWQNSLQNNHVLYCIYSAIYDAPRFDSWVGYPTTTTQWQDWCLQPNNRRGARWLSGRVSDSGARVPGFETYRRRVVSLSKTLYSPKVLVNYPGSDGSVPTWLKNCWLGR